MTTDTRRGTPATDADSRLSPVTVKVNGQDYTRQVENRTLLVDLLRDRIGLTGTHIGCEEGICGACTVEVDGDIVKSCLVLAVEVHGAEVVTVEGCGQKSDGVPRTDAEGLGAVQLGFWENCAVQCGFCTPGMVVASTNLLRTNPKPTEEDVRRHLVGNLCRCTGYQNLIAGVLSAARTIRGEV